MNLPENKTERIKLLIVAVLGAGAVVYGAVYGIGKPIIGKHQQYKKDIEQISRDLNDAKLHISHMERIRTENAAIVADIREIADKYLLRSRHGNFLIGARRLIERAAERADVQVQAVGEVGISVLDRGSDDGDEPSLKAYAARAVAVCDIFELMSLLEVLETANPYLCVSRLEIMVNPKEPRRHQVSFHVQWPVWSDPAVDADLKQQLSEAEATSGRGRRARRQES